MKKTRILATLVAAVLLALAAPAQEAPPAHRVEDAKIKPPPRTIWIEVLDAGQPVRRATLEITDNYTKKTSRIQTDNFGKYKLVAKPGVPHTAVFAMEGYMIQASTNMFEGDTYRFDAQKLGPGDGWQPSNGSRSDFTLPGYGDIHVMGGWGNSTGNGPSWQTSGGFTIEGRTGFKSSTPNTYYVYTGESYVAVKGAKRTRFKICNPIPGRGSYLIYRAEKP